MRTTTWCLESAARQDYRKWFDDTVAELRELVDNHHEREAQLLMDRLAKRGRTRSAGAWAVQPKMDDKGRKLVWAKDKAEAWRKFMAGKGAATEEEAERPEMRPIPDTEIDMEDQILTKAEIELAFKR